MRTRRHTLRKHSITWRAWLLFFALALVWGSSFILIKKSLLSLTPLQVALGRVWLTGLGFLPFIIHKIRTIHKVDYKYFALVAIVGNALPAFLYALAETEVQSGIAGLLNALTPIFTLLFGLYMFQHRRIPLIQKIGVWIGFAGAALIFFTGTQFQHSSWSSYALLIVLATAGYGLSSNIVEKYLASRYDSTTIAGLPFLLLFLPAGIALLFTDIQRTFQSDTTWTALAALLLLSLVGTLWASIAFFRLLKWTDAVFASSVSYFIPIVALLWGLYDGETFLLGHLLSLILILAGVYLTKMEDHDSH